MSANKVRAEYFQELARQCREWAMRDTGAEREHSMRKAEQFEGQASIPGSTCFYFPGVGRHDYCPCPHCIHCCCKDRDCTNARKGLCVCEIREGVLYTKAFIHQESDEWRFVAYSTEGDLVWDVFLTEESNPSQDALFDLAYPKSRKNL